MLRWSCIHCFAAQQLLLILHIHLLPFIPFETLSSLQEFRISGDLSLIQVARYRNLNHVELLTPINLEEMRQFLEVFVDGNRSNFSVMSLGVALILAGQHETIAAMRAIGAVFRGIKHLVLFSQNINAKLVSLLIPTLLVRLKTVGYLDCVSYALPYLSNDVFLFLVCGF